MASLHSARWFGRGVNRSFPSSLGLLYQNEGKRSAVSKKMIFHSHANKTHFQKKGCGLGLILKVRVFVTAYYKSHLCVEVLLTKSFDLASTLCDNTRKTA